MSIANAGVNGASIIEARYCSRNLEFDTHTLRLGHFRAHSLGLFQQTSLHFGNKRGQNNAHGIYAILLYASHFQLVLFDESACIAYNPF